MFDYQDIQAALAAAPPGTVIEVHLIRIVVPTAEAPAGPPPDVDAPVTELMPLRHDAGPRTPLERLRVLRREDPAVRRKESEWAGVLCRPDFPARELDRACQAGVIAHEKKGTGKDAGARMINAADLEIYLELRDRVQRGSVPEPEWWTSVVSTRNRSAA